MPTETHRLQEEPPEGSRETIDKELERQQAERKRQDKDAEKAKGARKE
ncbi:MAG: hypothetical protein ACTHJ3_19520 [Pararhizobium sp.]